MNYAIGAFLIVLVIIFILFSGFMMWKKYCNIQEIYTEIPNDVVIPVGPMDTSIVMQIIPTLERNVLRLGKIYLIGDISPPKNQRVIVVPESVFPFTKTDVANYGIPSNRVGWYIQQLYKLYAGRVIPTLTSNFLAWDADTFLLTPQLFFVPNTQTGRFVPGDQYHMPYFIHMKKLHPAFERQDKNLSGICNFMPFNKAFLEEMMNMVENYHKNTNLPFWKLFLEKIDTSAQSGASEYEIYFNFLIRFHPEAFELMKPTPSFDNVATEIPDISSPKKDIVSVHWYRRGKK